MAKERAMYYSEQTLGGGRTAISTVWKPSDAERAKLAAGGDIYLTLITNGELVPAAVSTVNPLNNEREVEDLQQSIAKLESRLLRLNLKLASASWHHRIGLKRRIKATIETLVIDRERLALMQEVNEWLYG